MPPSVRFSDHSTTGLAASAYPFQDSESTLQIGEPMAALRRKVIEGIFNAVSQNNRISWYSLNHRLNLDDKHLSFHPVSLRVIVRSTRYWKLSFFLTPQLLKDPSIYQASVIISKVEQTSTLVPRIKNICLTYQHSPLVQKLSSEHSESFSHIQHFVHLPS